MARSLLASSLENASLNIIFQVLLRCVTFILNAVVLRYVSQAVVGVMNVRLLLLESTILFLSRQAFRRASLSQTGSHSWPQIINLLWLTVPLSIAVSITFSIVWLYVVSVPSDDITPHYTLGVWSISISCVVEMLSEPLFLVAQAFLFIKLQVVMNSLVVFIRTLIFAPWIIFFPNQAVVAFSAAQIIANTAYCLGYYVYFYFYIQENNKNQKEKIVSTINEKINSGEKPDSGELDKILHEIQSSQKSEIYQRNENCDGLLQNRGQNTENEVQDSTACIHGSSCDKQGCDKVRPRLDRRQSSIVGFDEPFPFTSLRDFLPSAVGDECWIHPNSAQLTWSFLKQGVLKQVLTEGERYVMTLFSVMTFNQQGVYDVVNNLGSLAARFLFRPIEDSLYFYFSQSIRREVDIKDQNSTRMKEASTVLHQVLSCITCLGLVIVVFGQSYSSLLLYLYGGESLSTGQGPSLLQAHCMCVFLLGVNGITECYAFSTMTTEQLNKYNYLMAVFSIMFLVMSWGLTRLFGGVGFIIANCCNMSARIIHSIIFIKSRYKNTHYTPLDGLTPNKYFLISLGISGAVTKLTEHFCNKFIHFLFGGFCFTFVLIVWGLQERELVLLAIKKWRERKKKVE